ncbi:hypothetical protein MAJ_08885, partial [Metarhizium majus ARSEF 297]
MQIVDQSTGRYLFIIFSPRLGLSVITSSYRIMLNRFGYGVFKRVNEGKIDHVSALGKLQNVSKKPFAEDVKTQAIGRAKAVCRMYSTLEALAQNKFKPGALALAKIITFFWKEHFTTEPIFKQVMFLLQTQGNSQSDWFGSSVPRDPDTLESVIQDVSQLNLTEGPVSDVERARQVVEAADKKAHNYTKRVFFEAAKKARRETILDFFPCGLLKCFDYSSMDVV